MRLEDLPLPKDWGLLTLERITDKKIVYGIVQAGPHVPDGIPYIKSSDVGSNIDVKSLQRTAPTIHEKYRRSSVGPGDIIFSLRGNIAETSKVPSSLPIANLTQGTARISVEDKHFNDYVRYQLSNHYVLNRISAVAKGSTFKEISLGELRKLHIPFPSNRDEEVKISNILYSWDKAIETVEKLIESSRTQKKALMQQLLNGKKRLPGFSKPWREVRFNKVFERVTQKNTIGNDNVLTISGQYGLVNQRDYFNKSVASDNLSGYTLLKRGDFAYNKSYSKGYPMGAIKPLTKYDQGVVSSLYICFRLKENKTPSQEFFRHYFEAGIFNREIYAIAQEGARNHGLLNVSVTDFFNAKLHIPEPSEKEAIEKVIHTAEQELHNLEAQLKSLQDQKKSLMQQLLTGKRRVKVDTAEAKSA